MRDDDIIESIVKLAKAIPKNEYDVLVSAMKSMRWWKYVDVWEIGQHWEKVTDSTTDELTRILNALTESKESYTKEEGLGWTLFDKDTGMPSFFSSKKEALSFAADGAASMRHILLAPGVYHLPAANSDIVHESSIDEYYFEGRGCN